MVWPSFLDPYMLLLLIAVPPAYIFYRNSQKKKKAAAMAFSHLGVIRSAQKGKDLSWRMNILFYMTMAAIVLMIIGFADPHLPLEKAHEGVNVVLTIDVSGSMKAEDYKPNRIEAAKDAAKTLVDSLYPNDHVGIVVFESGATTAAYLSPFKERVMSKLVAIQAKDGATAIGDGLALSIDMAISIPNKKKVVILLSDGVNNAGVISPAEAISYAKSNNIQVHTIAMGSDQPVLLGYDWFGQAHYIELDEELLRSIAHETGGMYFKTVDSGTLDSVYETISEDIESEKEQVSVKDWFFALAALILIAEIYIRYGKYRVIQ